MAAFQQLGPFISTFAEAEEKISENEDSSCFLSETTVDTPKNKSKDDEGDTKRKEEKPEEQPTENNDGGLAVGAIKCGWLNFFCMGRLGYSCTPQYR